MCWVVDTRLGWISVNFVLHLEISDFRQFEWVGLGILNLS